jgi:hypothetical protein
MPVELATSGIGNPSQTKTRDCFVAFSFMAFLSTFYLFSLPTSVFVVYIFPGKVNWLGRACY